MMGVAVVAFTLILFTTAQFYHRRSLNAARDGSTQAKNR